MMEMKISNEEKAEQERKRMEENSNRMMFNSEYEHKMRIE